MPLFVCHASLVSTPLQELVKPRPPFAKLVLVDCTAQVVQLRAATALLANDT